MRRVARVRARRDATRSSSNRMLGDAGAGRSGRAGLRHEVAAANHIQHQVIILLVLRLTLINTSIKFTKIMVSSTWAGLPWRSRRRGVSGLPRSSGSPASGPPPGQEFSLSNGFPCVRAVFGLAQKPLIVQTIFGCLSVVSFKQRNACLFERALSEPALSDAPIIGSSQRGV